MADGQGAVDDAHSQARNALAELKELPIGSLNDTERELAVSAIKKLHKLDAALGERSTIGTEPLGMEVVGADDIDVEFDAEHAAAPKDDDIQVVDSLQEAMEDSDEPDPDGPAGRVLDTLREEDELAGPELKTLAEVGNVYTAISKLDDDGLIEKRDDPDDGRRTLYRPADWLVDGEEDDGPVWNGRDPEAVVADSSLPARVVLDDILDAVADADTLNEVGDALDVDVDNLEPVCWELTLKKPNSLEVVDDAGEQIETIREVAA